MLSEILSGVRQRCALSSTLLNYIIDWSFGQALQDYPGVQVGANVHVSVLTYADDIVILSSSYSEMQGLLEAVNCHAAAVGMRINASKTTVMSALIPGEQRQAVLLDGEPLEDVDKFKYLGSMFVANGQGTEEIRSKINLARSAFSRLQSGLWSWREISLRTKGRVYQAVVRSILLYGCETCPIRVADERMLEVFDNDSILRVRRRGCVR